MNKISSFTFLFKLGPTPKEAEMTINDLAEVLERIRNGQVDSTEMLKLAQAMHINPCVCNLKAAIEHKLEQVLAQRERSASLVLA